MQRRGHSQGPREARDHQKKKLFTYREKSEEKRAEYEEELGKIEEDLRVYIDECGILREYERESAYAPSGERIHAERSGRNRKTTNVVGALCGKERIGIELHEGTTNAAVFEDWFARLLARLSAGCTVILDNAKFHRYEVLKEPAGKHGIGVPFLQPCSPDLNPIEKTWRTSKNSCGTTDGPTGIPGRPRECFLGLVSYTSIPFIIS